MSLTLVLGGTRSGKSAVAEGLLASQEAVTYLATGTATDPEMAERIALHRARRPETWTTVELGEELAGALVAVSQGRAVLLDGLGAWVASRMHHAGAFDDPTRLEAVALAVTAEVDALAAVAASRADPVVVVCEEAGLAPVAADAATRRWVDLLGACSQRLARDAEQVLLVVAGRALKLPVGGSAALPGPVSTPPIVPTSKPDHGDRLVPPGHEDFAVNVVPGGPPPWLTAVLSAAPLDRYPDERPVRAAVAARHGRPPDEVLLLNGAAEAFWLLASTLTPVHPVIVTPSFTEPGTALRAHGHVPTLVRRSERDGFALEPAAIPDDADLVFLTNPDNPTGVLHDADTVATLARPGRVLVIDESFMDLVVGEAGSLAGRRDLPGLVVLRSLTKSLGIPGIRAGHLLGPPELVAQLAARRQAWPLNALALAALSAWTQRDAPTAVLAERYAVLRERFVTALERLPGVEVVPGAANFVLVRVPDGPRVRAALETHRTAVRPTSDMGLGEHHLRVAVRDEPAQDRFLAALAAAL